MPKLPRLDEMSLSTLRGWCKDLNLDVSGDKPTLVARFATFEIHTIAPEYHRRERSGADSRRAFQKLQRAVEARADQVYNVKKHCLMDEIENIKAELINIKVVRDEEKKEGMKRFRKQIRNAREKKKAVDAKGETPGSSPGLTGGKRVQGGKAFDEAKFKAEKPLFESMGNEMREVKKSKFDDEYDTQLVSEDEEDGDGGYQYMQYLAKKAMLSPVR